MSVIFRLAYPQRFAPLVYILTLSVRHIHIAVSPLFSSVLGEKARRVFQNLVRRLIPVHPVCKRLIALRLPRRSRYDIPSCVAAYLTPISSDNHTASSLEICSYAILLSPVFYILSSLDGFCDCTFMVSHSYSSANSQSMLRPTARCQSAMRRLRVRASICGVNTH